MLQFSSRLKAKISRAREVLTDSEFSVLVADAKAGMEAQAAVMQDVNIMRVKAASDPNFVMSHDAVPGNLLPRLLEIVVAQAEREYDVRYAWRDIFPVVTYDWTKKTVIIPVWSGEGMARWYNGGGQHPNVSVGMKEVTISLRTLTLSYVLDWLRVQQETGAGINTETEMLNQVFRGLDDFVSKVVFEGDTLEGIQPFVNHANITNGDVPYGEWDDSATTASEMFLDVMYAVNRVFAANRGVEGFETRQVDVLLPSDHYDILDSAIINTFTNQTVLDVLASKRKIRRIISVPKLETTAGGASDSLYVGVFDMEGITVPMGADRTAMPRHDGGWYIEQPYMSSTAGVHLKRPLWFFRGDNLNDNG